MITLLEKDTIWVLISFVIFCYVAYRFGRGALLRKLDTRIEDIRREISTAESLRIEAQELLAQYQRKQKDAAKESEAIISSARSRADEIVRHAEAELEQVAARREQQLTERLKRMEQSAIQEIQTHAAELAVKATKEIITEKMDKAANDRLVEQALTKLPEQL